MAEKTSAVVTCRNYGRYLSQCLESLLAQSRPFDEILVVDDGSSDETQSVLSRYSRFGIRSIQTSFSNQDAARRAGASAVQGGLLVFVDADDWLAYTYHEKMRASLLADTSAGFVYCGAHLAAEGFEADWFPGRFHPLRDYDFFDFWRRNPAATAPMLRRAAWEDAAYAACGVTGPDGTIYGEDWDRLLAILHRGWTAALVPERLVYYRLHGANTSRAVVSNRGMEEAAKHRIRERYTPYDLTVIFLFQQPRSFGGKTLSSFPLDGLPPFTQFLIARAGGPPWCPADFKPREFLIPRLPGMKPDAWIREALEKVSPQVRGRQVLLVSDRVRLSPSALRILLNEKQAVHAGIYSAHTALRREGTSHAWRSAGSDPMKGVMPIPVTRRPKRVLAAGLDLTLMDLNVLQDPGLFSYAEKNPFEPLEIALGMALRNRDIRWFARGAEAAVAFSNPPCENRKRACSELPKVSILIPVRNNAGPLGALLTSLKKIDYSQDRFEIIVIDNNSSDNSRETAASFPGVRVLTEKNLGSYFARNRGIRESTSPFLAFVDSDCIVTRSWLKDLVFALLQDPSAGACAGANRAAKPEAWLSRMERKAGVFRNYPGKPGGQPPYAITMNIAYRREVFETCGLFDETESGSDVAQCWKMQRAGWGLKILEDRGWVLHRDPDSPWTWARRHLRIGRGHDRLFARFPEYRPSVYRWMPETFTEIVLQALKKGTLALCDRQPRTSPRGEIILSILRAALLKTGFLEASRRRRKSAAARKLLVFFGRSEAPFESPAFPGLLKKAAEGWHIIYVAPAAPGTHGFARALASFAGLTACWEWAPGFRSLQHQPRPLLSRGAQLRNTMHRILRAAEEAGCTLETIKVTGDIEEKTLQEWFKCFEPGRADRLPLQQIFLHTLQPPAAGCILPPGAARYLNLDDYGALSQTGGQPVVIAGWFEESEIRFLEAFALEHSNLFILPIQAEDAGFWEKNYFETAVYAWKDAPSQDVLALLTEGLRSFSGSVLSSLGGWHLELPDPFHFRNRDEAFRWVRMQQLLPGWNWKPFWIPEPTLKPGEAWPARTGRLDAAPSMP